MNGFGLIYKVVSPNKKVYIGQTIKDLVERKNGHKKESQNTNNKGYAIKFHNALRKYGFDNFKWEVVLDDVPKEHLDELEKFLIWFHDSCENGYNSTLGGDCNPMKGKKHSELSKKKISEACGIGMRGKKHTKEAKQKMSLTKKERFKNGLLVPTLLGKHHSEETKRKISASNTGKKRTDNFKLERSKQTTGSNNPMYGKPSAMKGKKHSEETKQKMSKASKKYWESK